jgi:hypothetical protein
MLWGSTTTAIQSKCNRGLCAKNCTHVSAEPKRLDDQIGSSQVYSMCLVRLATHYRQFSPSSPCQRCESIFPFLLFSILLPRRQQMFDINSFVCILWERKS